MENLNTSTETMLTAEPAIAVEHVLANVYDLYECYSGRGLYHITIKGNSKPICGHKVKYYQAVGGTIIKHDSKYIYFEEPSYDERISPFINTYFNWQICKHCLRSLNIC